MALQLSQMNLGWLVSFAQAIDELIPPPDMDVVIEAAKRASRDDIVSREAELRSLGGKADVSVLSKMRHEDLLAYSIFRAGEYADVLFSESGDAGDRKFGKVVRCLYNMLAKAAFEKHQNIFNIEYFKFLEAAAYIAEPSSSEVIQICLNQYVQDDAYMQMFGTPLMMMMVGHFASGKTKPCDQAAKYFTDGVVITIAQSIASEDTKKMALQMLSLIAARMRG